MKPRHRRLLFVLFSLSLLAGGVGLVLVSLGENVEFFLTPTDLETRPAAEQAQLLQRGLRLGGLVEAGSVRRSGDGGVRFAVTDGNRSMEVHFRGLLPDLFREGQGVVARGRIDGAGVFQADQILAKHDENYMPPEVAEGLKRAGRFRAAGASSPEAGSPEARSP